MPSTTVVPVLGCLEGSYRVGQILAVRSPADDRSVILGLTHVPHPITLILNQAKPTTVDDHRRVELYVVRDSILEDIAALDGNELDVTNA